MAGICFDGDDVVDISEKINGHSFTIGWLLNSLRENDKIYQKLHGKRGVKCVTYYDVSKGKGFFSAILRCTLIFMDSINENDNYSTILKIPGFTAFEDASSKSDLPGELLDAQVKDKCVSMHKFECDFYNDVSPILDAPIPIVYKTVEWILGKQEGCIHMEDLTLRGKNVSFLENISLSQVKIFIQHLAKMHKNILSSDSKVWKGKFLKGQNCYIDFFDMYEAGYETFLKKGKNYDNLHDLARKYNKFSLNRDFYNYANKQSFIDLKIPPVLVHGDMHAGNIMFAIDSKGNVTHEIAAIVDWQTLHEGSPMSDLARFLVFCADGVVRRQAEIIVFDFYHKCFLEEFGGDSSKIPFTVEQLRKAYNFAFLTQAFFLLADTDFFFGTISDSEPNENLRNAYYDFGVLRILHAYQDIDFLLKGEMKDMFEKYGK